MIEIDTVPIAAVAVAEKVTVAVQVGPQGLFVKVAVTPIGRPDALKVTGVVVPLTKVTVMDEEGLIEPCATVRLLGEGEERLKSKVGEVTMTS